MARVSKLNIWLKHFLNESCSTTFLNRKESARRAGYKAKSEDSFRNIGYQNFTKLSDKIESWLDEAGLSENSLKLKLISLMNANETKFMKIKGAVTDSDLTEGIKKIAATGVVDIDDGKKEYSTGETIVAIEIQAIETQRKTLDMALNVRGMKAPKKFEHSGPDGGPIKTITADMDPKEAAKIYAQMLKGD